MARSTDPQKRMDEGTGTWWETCTYVLCTWLETCTRGVRREPKGSPRPQVFRRVISGQVFPLPPFHYTVEPVWFSRPV